MLIKTQRTKGDLKVKGDWLRWEEMALDELKVQIALGTLTHDELWKLLKSKILSNECAGWLYKRIDGPHPKKPYTYTFTIADEKRELVVKRVHTILARLERRELRKKLLEEQKLQF